MYVTSFQIGFLHVSMCRTGRDNSFSGQQSCRKDNCMDGCVLLLKILSSWWLKLKLTKLVCTTIVTGTDISWYKTGCRCGPQLAHCLHHPKLDGKCSGKNAETIYNKSMKISFFCFIHLLTELLLRTSHQHGSLENIVNILTHSYTDIYCWKACVIPLAYQLMACLNSLTYFENTNTWHV